MSIKIDNVRGNLISKQDYSDAPLYALLMGKADGVWHSTGRSVTQGRHPFLGFIATRPYNPSGVEMRISQWTNIYRAPCTTYNSTKHFQH